MSEWEVFSKFIQWTRGLEQPEQLALFGGGVTAIAPSLYLLWGRGHHSGFEDGKQHVLDGRVRQLEFDNLKLDTTLQNRPIELLTAKEHIKALQEEIKVLKASGSQIPVDVLEILDIKEKIAADDLNIWDLRQAIVPADYYQRFYDNRLKILLIGLLKGGVGKSTLTANLAAYLDRNKGKRVLIIDLDYQGSLSNALLKAVGGKLIPGQSEYLLSGLADGLWLVNNAQCLKKQNFAPNSLPNSYLLASTYPLARKEEQLLMRWVFGVSKMDVRYSMANVLLSDEVQKNFDVVLIDVGPRLTTASIAALFAATHLIIPTNVDMMAAETVNSFLSTIWDLKQRRKLPIEFAGVVGTMSYQKELTDNEKGVLERVQEGLSGWSANGKIFKQAIPRKRPLADNSGSEIGYFLNSEIRGIFDRLGDEIAERVGL